MLTLYQFQCSHYCEKARWALDYKGLAYEPRNLIPGPHRRTAERLAAQSHLPILVDGGLVDEAKVIQGSDAIIDHLDRRWPERRLTPLDTLSASLAAEWERYLDAEIGVSIRCWFYYYVLPERTLATRFLLQGAPWYGRPLYALIFPAVRHAMRKMMHIDAGNTARSEARLRAALERLNGALRGQRYLVGGAFSRADLTACARLAPLCLPELAVPAVADALPAAVARFRAEQEDAPFFAWVAETYRTHRAARAALGT
jgi:glutathione S-transferase